MTFYLLFDFFGVCVRGGAGDNNAIAEDAVCIQFYLIYFFIRIFRDNQFYIVGLEIPAVALNRDNRIALRLKTAFFFLFPASDQSRRKKKRQYKDQT